IHSPHGRPWPEALDYTTALIVFSTLFAAATAALIVPRLRRAAVVGLSAAAGLVTFFLLGGYLRQIAPYWSAKGPIGAEYKNRHSPEERLLAYQMYWRGETFYTKNEIYEGPNEERTVFDTDGADDRMKDWLLRHRGHRQFFLYERGQHEHIRSLLP